MVVCGNPKPSETMPPVGPVNPDGQLDRIVLILRGSSFIF
jgi:hypothetical protein